MAWVRIDDKFPQHPKIAAAGPLAMAMQVAGLCYCNRELTDGFIPRAIARTLLDWQIEREDGRLFTIAVTCGMVGDDLNSQWVIDLLCEVGMWVEVPGGYQIHDYADYQPTKQQILAERERKVAAGQAGGKASAQARAQAGASSGAKQTVKQNPTPKPNPNPLVLSEQELPPVVPQGGESQTMKPKRETKRATAVPDDFPITVDLRSWAAEKVPGVNLERETEKFLNHFRSNGKTMKDWTAAWRNWMLRSAEYNPQPVITAPSKPDRKANPVAWAIAEKARLEAGEWENPYERKVYTEPPIGEINLARELARLTGIINAAEVAA